MIAALQQQYSYRTFQAAPLGGKDCGVHIMYGTCPPIGLPISVLCPLTPPPPPSLPAPLPAPLPPLSPLPLLSSSLPSCLTRGAVEKDGELAALERPSQKRFRPALVRETPEAGVWWHHEDRVCHRTGAATGLKKKTRTHTHTKQKL